MAKTNTQGATVPWLVFKAPLQTYEDKTMALFSRRDDDDDELVNPRTGEVVETVREYRERQADADRQARRDRDRKWDTDTVPVKKTGLWG